MQLKKNVIIIIIPKNDVIIIITIIGTKNSYFLLETFSNFFERFQTKCSETNKRNAS